MSKTSISNNSNIEKAFLNEKLMRNVSIVSVIAGIISLCLMIISHEITPLLLFEKIVKILITILTLWWFTKFHWDAVKGMMGGLLFALLYQESFLVLGRLWGETSDFDAYLIMGVQGSLFLAAMSMNFLMTVIITINHFIIDYSRIGNYGNVIFNQMSIVFKILLYICLMIINLFLETSLSIQISSGFDYVSDLCIVIMIICIETQLDSFKRIREELIQSKREMQKLMKNGDKNNE